MRALIYLVLGVLMLVGGWFWAEALGHAVLTIVAALLMAAGGALVIAAMAIGLDKHSPTSHKL